MSGWHPNIPDGGMPPNSADPNNPSQAFPPTVPPNFASPLYYGNGCDVRLRPHVLNSLISENLQLLDSVGLNYNPGSFRNTTTAVEYIVQKGLPKWVLLYPQGEPPYYYRGALSPGVQPLNNGMVLTVLPTETNRGFVRVDVGNGWWVPVLTNNYEELKREDWPQYVPQLICYWNGAFYMLGLVKSQVPLVLVGAINFWVRWDGNDEEGDGTENTPEKAFRTLQGAWYAVGSRYAGSPGASIILRLGIPGDYEGATLGPFGAHVAVVGDENNPAAYRINTQVGQASWGPYCAWSLYVGGINNFTGSGINLVMSSAVPTPNSTQCLRCASSGGELRNMQLTLEAVPSNASAQYIIAESSAHLFSSGSAGRVRFVGNGHTLAYGWGLGSSSTIVGNGIGGPPSELIWENTNFTHANISVDDRSMVWFSNTRVSSIGVTGRRYAVGGFSILMADGQVVPGTIAGSLGTFSEYRP